MKVVFVGLLFLTFLFQTTSSMKSKEAGQNDWHYKNIGDIQHVVNSLDFSNFILLGSKEGVIALVNTRTGNY